MDIVEKILEIARELPVTDQLQLRNELNRITLDEVDPSTVERVSRYLSVMNKLIRGDVRKVSRKRDLVNGRTVLGYFMYAEGLGVEKIGKMLGKDHSTVTHYLRRMDNALSTPKSDPDLYALYKKFKSKIGYD